MTLGHRLESLNQAPAWWADVSKSELSMGDQGGVGHQAVVVLAHHGNGLTSLIPEVEVAQRPLAERGDGDEALAVILELQEVRGTVKSTDTVRRTSCALRISMRSTRRWIHAFSMKSSAAHPHPTRSAASLYRSTGNLGVSGSMRTDDRKSIGGCCQCATRRVT
jgi:hypothetical protein